MSDVLLRFLGWAVDATVKGSVVILLVVVVQRMTAGRIDARWRHALWMIVVVRLLLPGAPSTPWSIFNLLPASAAEPIGAAKAAAVPHIAQQVPFVGQGPARVATFTPWLAIWRQVAAIWILGVIVLLSRALIATVRTHLAVQRALRSGSASREVREIVHEAKRALHVTAPLRVVETDMVKAPALHGLIRPTLLLPASLAESMTVRELRHVVLHELWHLRRFDVAINWVLAALAALHWFNPFVWFAVARIQEERELACDELALSCLEEEERSGYGRTILKLLECFRAAEPVPAVVGIVNEKRRMKRRLTMIATFRDRSRFPIIAVGAVLIVSALALTNARGGERHFMKKLDPAAAQTFEKLDQRISFDLTSASLNDLLVAVANKTGVTIAQAPAIATSDAQTARFTIHAENVPAHAVLMEALMPFKLAPYPDANGVTIVDGSEHMMILHDDNLPEPAPGEARKIVVEKDVKTTDDSTQEHVFIRHSGDEKAGEKRIFIHANGTSGPMKLNADGTLHRELTLNIEENGVTSQGKLVIDIGK